MHLSQYLMKLILDAQRLNAKLLKANGSGRSMASKVRVREVSGACNCPTKPEKQSFNALASPDCLFLRSEPRAEQGASPQPNDRLA